MKVCHLIHELGPGGAEHVLLHLARAAPEAGLELSVVSPMPFAGHDYPGRLRALGVEVRSLDLATRWDPRGLRLGRAAVADLGPDVIHTHLKHADLIGAYAAWRLGIPLVSTLHLMEGGARGMDRAKQWLAAQVRLRTAGRTIAVSDAVRDWYSTAFDVDPDSVVTIHNGLVPPIPLTNQRRLALRRDLGIGADDLMATMVAVMRPGKGHEELLAAAARVADDIGVRFVLAGDGPERPALESAARAAGLGADHVVFAGFREDVADLVAASDLVVHPSGVDALPTALIYALAAGRPTVASDAGGIPEIVNGEVGLLVPPGDVAAFAEAVRILATDVEERVRMGKAAREWFDAEFTASTWTRRLRRLYEQVIG
ncbi:MAG: glycosyltransferase family 4 protein [Acidimicrobiia bacterium]